MTFDYQKKLISVIYSAFVAALFISLVPYTFYFLSGNELIHPENREIFSYVIIGVFPFFFILGVIVGFFKVSEEYAMYLESLSLKSVYIYQRALDRKEKVLIAAIIRHICIGALIFFYVLPTSFLWAIILTLVSIPYVYKYYSKSENKNKYLEEIAKYSKYYIYSIILSIFVYLFLAFINILPANTEGLRYVMYATTLVLVMFVSSNYIELQLDRAETLLNLTKN